MVSTLAVLSSSPWCATQYIVVVCGIANVFCGCGVVSVAEPNAIALARRDA